MFSKKEEPRLLIPALKPFYDRVIPLSWVVVRFAVGWNLLVHAYFSIGRGPLALAPVFEKMGFAPGNVFAGTTFLIELLGGIRKSAWSIHAFFRRSSGNRDACHLFRILECRLPLAQRWLRICIDVGPRFVRDCAAGRRTIFA